jgi:hypothetical protein
MNKVLVLRVASLLLALAAVSGCTMLGSKTEGADGTTGSRITVTDGVYHAPEGQVPPPWAHNPPLDTPKSTSTSSRSGHGLSPHEEAAHSNTKGVHPPPPPDASIDVRTAPRGTVSSATLRTTTPGASGAGGSVPRGGISAVDPVAPAPAPAPAKTAHPASPPAVIDTGKSPAMQ